MTVYVDELFVTKRALADPQANRVFGNGKSSCHLTADTPGELHVFAARLGLRREWVQHVGRLTIHYDLTPQRRRAAVTLGAVEVTAREDARRIVRAMQAARCAGGEDT